MNRYSPYKELLLFQKESTLSLKKESLIKKKNRYFSKKNRNFSQNESLLFKNTFSKTHKFCDVFI